MTVVEIEQAEGQQEDLYRALALVDEALNEEITSLQARLDGKEAAAASRASVNEILRGTAESIDETSGARWWEPISRLHLSPIERTILLFAVAPEATRRAGYQYSMLGDDPAQTWPTVDLLVRLLSCDPTGAHHVRSLLRSGAPLFSSGILRLFRLRDTDSSLTATVQPASLIVSRLLQLPDEIHQSIRVRPARGEDELAGSFDQDTLENLYAMAEHIFVVGKPLVLARSDRVDAAFTAAHYMAVRLERAVIEVDLTAVDATERDAAIDLARLLRLLDDAVCAVIGSPAGHHCLRNLFENGAGDLAGRPILAGIDDWADAAPSVLRIGRLVDLAHPDAKARRVGWVAALLQLSDGANVSSSEVDMLAQRYEFARPEVNSLLETANLTRRTIDFSSLVRAAEIIGGSAMDGLAQQVKTGATWEDIVVSDETMAELRHVASIIRHRYVVMSEHRVGNRHGSNGAAVLFAGPSGTGKTLAASVIASDLSAPLFRVNLATVVSKYIGETEKNLERIFAAAQRSGAMLLFDEADAIFGKRSEVRDAHDRHANLETAYLLQRIEGHNGTVILTTNARHNLDSAFLRRFAAIVQFQEPSEVEQARLWDVLLHTSMPRDDTLNLRCLASVATMTGGEMATVLIDAATEATDSTSPLNADHIRAAVKRLQNRRGR